MRSDPEEPPLPYTPSHTGRRARVGYLGLDGVGFNDLWPVFLGLALSIAAALRYFVADAGSGAHWLPRTLVSLLPFTLGFGYLRLLVMGRPPHFRGDLLATVLSLRVDLSDPPVRSLPVLPRISSPGGAPLGPARSAQRIHPLCALGRAPI